MTVAAFDFDGTITRKDSSWAFLFMVKGPFRVGLGVFWLMPMLIGFKLGWIDRQLAKEQLMKHFLGGMSQEALAAYGKRFFEEKLSSLIRPQALERLQWHQENDHRCLLVTASYDIWTADWAAANGMELVASRSAYEAGVFQGKIVGENCRGPEKVKRIEALLGGKTIEKTYAYGDTSGDHKMLAWADEAYFKPFRNEKLIPLERETI